MIGKYRIRASYPNFYMVNLYARHGEEIFNHDSDDPANRLEGNKPGTVIYYRDDDKERHELPPRWYDMYHLLKMDDTRRERYLQLLIEAADGTISADGSAQLRLQRDSFRQQCQQYVEQHPLVGNEYLIHTLSEGTFTDEEISHKGRMLLDLTRNSYPVPDFCILTAAAFRRHDLLPRLLEDAIANLEVMTDCRLGDSHKPLVFAIRCAMPQYIPGLMPTLLNIGVTRAAYEGLRHTYAESMANRVYLSTLHTLCEMLDIHRRYIRNDIELDCDTQRRRIAEMEEQIVDKRLLNDARYQTLRLLEYVRGFFIQNQDLVLTFMQGKQAFPSFILQRMVWTIGNNESYPGVLYSRHSRTGQGRQIESYRNIFGEEIMTGDVTSEDRAYNNRADIKNEFPAVYHFDPLLSKLESRYKSPVTIEFAVESRPRRLSLFSVLQLNMSEMTGRAALLAATDMYNAGLIDESAVTDLVKPYHLRQIVSASIDDHSLRKLEFFGRGLSVLPRSAISTTLCFSINEARQHKENGEYVCLCQERFVPEDTITLNEVDAIISLTPAAIHVVTACRGYGIPAFLDLQHYGIQLRPAVDGRPAYLCNEQGSVLTEGEKITLSSKRQSIYRGVADFRPARFTKYLQGKNVELSDDEKIFFQAMKEAYRQYQNIVTSEQVNYITDVDKLARLIRCDLQNKPDVARNIVNSWYETHSDRYINQVLGSRMGDHQDQSRVFDLLGTAHKTEVFKQSAETCITKGLSGLKAGSFMLGRFVARPLPIKLWNSLSDTVVAFLLNEYVLYEKYLHVLEEVGEIKLARAHSRIETEGVDNMNVSNFDLYTFVPLLYSTHDWTAVAKALETIDHQDNTHVLIAKLSQPVEKIFDMSKPWNKARVEEVLKAQNSTPSVHSI
ncbi:MAG: pyruvate, phosphate dikinase [bacterium P3]|nr:MAG: pyruvate, phosphate dikinase [bacterium P3]KWW41963.1 MAG: pyruvate, phosphate dikinase [bacterium F083]